MYMLKSSVHKTFELLYFDFVRRNLVT